MPYATSSDAPAPSLPHSDSPSPTAQTSVSERLFGGGTHGNELLTATTGTVLIALLAVLGATIIALGQLLWLHLFVGLMLIGPVVLKLASTGYRFALYYARNPRYRAVGPPITPLRLIAPIVVLSTLVVFVSGVVLLFAGPSSRSTLLPIHKLSFIVWIAFTSLHVLGHLPAIGRALRDEYALASPVPRIAGRDGRALSLLGAIAAGLVLAIVLLPEFGAWLHHFHHH